jgi:probable phosphoglycerate mutase
MILEAMRRILLARHGQTAWNALGKLQGHTDIPLDDTGRAQARALAATLVGAGVRSVWTSDLSRARETADIVAGILALEPPRTEPGLRERRFGVFEGLTRDECMTHHPEAWQAWTARTVAPPGGEPIDEAVQRMRGALERIVALDEGPALVVSHGGVMRLWLMDLIGAQVPVIGNAATFVVEHDGAKFHHVR